MKRGARARRRSDDRLARRVALAGLSLVRGIGRAPAGVYTLCYHHIPARDRANFERQLEYLGRNGVFVSADQARQLVCSGGAAEGRFFLLSFDDGYADLVDVAQPVLAERGISAIAFVVTSWLTSPPDKTASRADGYMTPADLLRWHASGMDIGSHTHTHRQLVTLTEPEVRDELRRSSAVLAEITGERPHHFACPWGVPERDFRLDETPRLMREEGYVSLFTTTRGVATDARDLGLMPRHVLEPHWPLYQVNALLGRRGARPHSARPKGS